jgi:hypothetical protein
LELCGANHKTQLNKSGRIAGEIFTHHRPEIGVRQDKPIVCGYERITIDSQLEKWAENELRCEAKKIISLTTCGDRSLRISVMGISVPATPSKFATRV